MKHWKILFPVILLIVLMASNVFAGGKTSTDTGYLGNDQWIIQSDGDLIPETNNAYDIGSSSFYPANIYLGGVGKASWGSVVSPWEDSGTTTILTSAPTKFILTHSTGVSSFTGYIAGAADIVLENSQIIDGGTGNQVILTANSDNFDIEFTGNDITLRPSDGGIIFVTDASDATGTFEFQARADVDDYLVIDTISNVPTIATLGSSNLALVPDGGTVVITGILTVSGAQTFTGITTLAAALTFSNGEELINTTNGTLSMAGAASPIFDILAEGTSDEDAILSLTADAGANNGDVWRINSDGGTNDLLFENNTSGSQATILTLDSDGTLTTTGDILVAGTTPKLTIGDGGGEDVIIQYDGVVDYYIANDDSEDDLVIGKGSTVATTEFLTFLNDSFVITVGDASAANSGFGFDGNAVDYHIGIYDTGDTFTIGKGLVPGTTPAITIDTNQNVLFSQNVLINEFNYFSDAQGSDTYVVTLAPAATAYTTGLMIVFKANTANTDECTVNVNGLGAKFLLEKNDVTATTNYIEAGSIVWAVYDGSAFQMLQPDANP